MNNWKAFFILGVIAIIGVSIALTVYITRLQTNQRSKAAASTTLSFSPSSQNVGIGQPVNADVNLDPGSNQVSILKLIISYDGSKFDQNSAVITASLINPNNAGPNPQGFFQIIQPFANTCNGSNCLMSITMSIGSTPTYVITQPQKVASITLKPIAATNGTTTTVAVDPSTAVYSIAAQDQSSENVLQLSSLIPLAVTIGSSGITPTPPVCNASQSTCQWDAVSGAVSYHYKIVDTTTNKTVIESDTQDGTTTSVPFNSTAGDTYQCSITATNICHAISSPGQATRTCPIIPTPTPTSCPTPGTVANLKMTCPNCNNQ